MDERTDSACCGPCHQRPGESDADFVAFLSAEARRTGQPVRGDYREGGVHPGLTVSPKETGDGVWIEPSDPMHSLEPYNEGIKVTMVGIVSAPQVYTRARITDICGRVYEFRRYDDGVLCRRIDELKVGDRVRYIRRTTEQTVEGTVYGVTTMPEGAEDAGKPAYRLAFSADVVEAIGHPVVIPHSRVELIWPESAIAATGFVLLHEGRRLGWKVLRGPVSAWHPDFRYYGAGPEAPSPTLCTVERQSFTAWDDAVTWCASFLAHPAETGRPPTLDDLQPERGPDDEVVLQTVSTNDNDAPNDAPKGEE